MGRFLALAIVGLLVYLILRASVNAFLAGFRGAQPSGAGAARRHRRAGQGSRLRDLHPAPQGDQPRKRPRHPVLLQRRLRRPVRRALVTRAPRPPLPPLGRGLELRSTPAGWPRHGPRRRRSLPGGRPASRTRGASPGSSRPAARQPHQARLRRGFLSLAGVGPGARVLDVGCGTGVVTRDVAARVGARGRAVGVDPSRALLRVARRRLAASAGGVAPTFRHGRWPRAAVRIGVVRRHPGGDRAAPRTGERPDPGRDATRDPPRRARGASSTRTSARSRWTSPTAR